MSTNTAPDYHLLGSLTSPYVRRLRLYMGERIAHSFEKINYLDNTDDARLSRINPTKKIPVLLIKGEPLWESRVIFNHLQRTHDLRPMTMAEENAISAADSLLDQLIQGFLMRRNGIAVDPRNAYFERQADRQQLVLKYLASEATVGRFQSWDYPSMCVYSLLDWALFREAIPARELPPALVQLVAQHGQRPDVLATDPRRA